MLCTIENEESKTIKLSSDLANILNKEASGEIKNFIETAYTNIVMSLIKYIYLENKALEYLMLKENDIKFPLDVSLLGAVHSKIVDKDQIQYLESRKTVSQYIKSASDEGINLTPGQYPIQFENVKKSLDGKHVFEFTITPFEEAFRANWFEIYADSVSVKLFGCETNNKRIAFKLTQLGKSTFITSQGKVVQYVHQPRSIPLTYYYEKDIFGEDITQNLVGKRSIEKEFYELGISPFASWRIEIFDDQNIDLDLSSLSKINVNFSFYTKSKE